jgi:hypothetical protein
MLHFASPRVALPAMHVNVQSFSQPLPLMFFPAPLSHSSGASTTPFPHVCETPPSSPLVASSPLPASSPVAVVESSPPHPANAYELHATRAIELQSKLRRIMIATSARRELYG